MFEILQLDEEDFYHIDNIIHQYVNSGMVFGWKSNADKPYDFGHWTSNPLPNSKIFPIDHMGKEHMKQHPSVEHIWKKIRPFMDDTMLYHVYLNGQTYGTDTYFHRDSQDWVKKLGDDYIIRTGLIYLNKDWYPDYGGYTVIIDDNNEITKAVMPKMGRIVLFDGHKVHGGTAISRAFPGVRLAMPLKAVDKRVESDVTKYLIELGLDKIRYDAQKTLFKYAFDVMIKIEMTYFDPHVLKLDKSKDKVDLLGAALFHCVYGLQEFSANLNVTKDKVKKLIGEYSEYLVTEMSNMTNRVESLLLNRNEYDTKTWLNLMKIESGIMSTTGHYRSFNMLYNKIMEIEKND